MDPEDGDYDDQDYDYEFPAEDNEEEDNEELLEQQQMMGMMKNEHQPAGVGGGNDGHEDEDEQHQQKVNGQMEFIQEQLKQKEMEILSLKEQNEEMKIQLSKVLTRLEEKSIQESSQEMLTSQFQDSQSQIRELQKEIQTLKQAPISTPTSSSSTGHSPATTAAATTSAAPAPVTAAAAVSYEKLMKTFLNFSSQHSLENPAMDLTEMNETICLSLLAQTTKKLNEKNIKKSTSMTTSGMMASDSELQQRIHNLEEELRLALGAAEDIRALKAKAISLVERIRLEKEEKLRCESEQKVYIKKIEMLSDHVEKLMIHLKHEAAAKIKTMDQLRASEKRNETAQLKLGIVSRKAAAKDRLIAELREGSKILEDQLRLMDEKYLELRTKLDYAREVAAKKVKVAQKTASDLRMKFALAGNTKLLDHIPLPDINSNTAGTGMGTGDYTMYSTDGFGATGDYSRSMPTLSMTSPQPLSRSMGSSNNLLKSSGTAGSTSGKRRGKKKSSYQTIAKDTEQSTERVLDKIRRLRGGQQEWTEEKVRNLVKSH